MDKRTVRIVYYNAKHKPIGETEYGFEEYTQMIRLDLLKVISDIEDLVYAATGGKRKQDWPPELINGFNKIKHRLLDKAGEVQRLPETLCSETEKKTDPLGDFIASVFKTGKDGKGEG